MNFLLDSILQDIILLLGNVSPQIKAFSQCAPLYFGYASYIWDVIEMRNHFKI